MSGRRSFAIALLAPPPSELELAVDAVGAELAARIRKVNATPVEADPGYKLAGDTEWWFAGSLTMQNLARVAS